MGGRLTGSTPADRSKVQRGKPPKQPAKKAKRGGVESRHAPKPKAGLAAGEESARPSGAEFRAAAETTALPSRAGVATSPRKVFKRGRPRLEDADKTLAATKPWLALKMSRSTWFARRREKQK